MTDNLYSLIRDRNPDLARPCIETADGRILAYGDVFAGAGRMANALRGLGVGPEDRVVVQVEKSTEALLLYLGCLAVGAVFLPLNNAYTLNELDYFIGDAEPALVVCRPADKAGVDALCGKLKVPACVTLGQAGDGSLMEKVAAASPEFRTVERGPDDLACILYTSGTTGRSKGAMLTHRNLSSNALVLIDYWRFTRDDVLLHALPIFHAHGLFVASNVMLLVGGRMIFLPRFDPDEALRRLPGATAMMGVPTFYTRLLQHPGLTPEATRHMRVFISGSAPLLAETHDAWKARTGHAILERYGMTETVMNTSNPYDGDRVPGTVGFPLPGVSARIAEPESGKPLPQGEIGVIEVKGPNVFKGYWRMPEKTAQEFRADGFFVTGDLGRIDERGYIHIIGRAKDLIISGGYNVYPKEIESEINLIPGVVESAVIGVPHPDFGEGVAAVVVPQKDASLTEKDVLAALDGRLARFKQPKRVLFVDELPRNTMGKVQKNVLVETNKGLFAG